jgi:hypothetical protein
MGALVVGAQRVAELEGREARAEVGDGLAGSGVLVEQAGHARDVRSVEGVVERPQRREPEPQPRDGDRDAGEAVRGGSARPRTRPTNGKDALRFRGKRNSSLPRPAP